MVLTRDWPTSGDALKRILVGKCQLCTMISQLILLEEILFSSKMECLKCFLLDLQCDQKCRPVKHCTLRFEQEIPEETAAA